MSKLYGVEDAIVSISSGLSPGAIGLIRLSGKNSFRVAASFLSPSASLSSPQPGRVYYLKALKKNGGLLDRVVTINYIAPKSFTGENMVEIFCHGSTYIMKELLGLALENGARQARPGEFSMRAFLNGKMDLSQAEALNDLIKSETEGEHRAALNQAEGKLSAGIKNIKDKLLFLLAGLEARIDDSYEETDKINEKDFRKRLSECIGISDSLASTFSAGKYVKNGVKVVITGAPNSGKSSLLNALLGYDRAIVSPSPGTTRDTLEEKTEIEGYRIIFTDTAGIRNKLSGAVEKEGIKRTTAAVNKSDLVLFLRDGSSKKTRQEETAWELTRGNISPGAEIIELFSKSDLKLKREGKHKKILKISSYSGAGLEDLKKVLAARASASEKNFENGLITSVRHHRCLSEASAFMKTALSLRSFSEKTELAAENLRLALNSLSEIIGETAPEEVLRTVFSNFCVGK